MELAACSNARNRCRLNVNRGHHRMGTLHGIPVFFLFRGRRVVGRITGWPGAAAFADAIAKQIAAPPR